MRTVYKKILYM